MTPDPEMQLFRPDSYPQGVYTPEDVAEIAASYDPGVHEAPLCIGHKENDERAKTGEDAHGWFKRLYIKDGLLAGLPIQISDVIKNSFGKGRLKKWSVEIYPRHNSPVKGKLYLKAVSMLGAGVPQVKGLRQTCFKEEFDESISIFQERESDNMDGITKADLDSGFSKLIEGIKGIFAGKKFSEPEPDPDGDLSIDEALEAMSEPEVEELLDKMAGSERISKIADAMNAKEETVRMSELEKNPDHKFRVESTKKGITDWVDTQIKSKRLSPKVKDLGLVKFMEMLAFSDTDNEAIKFAEKGDEMTPLAFFQKCVEENLNPTTEEIIKDNDDPDNKKKKVSKLPMKFSEKNESGIKIEYEGVSDAEQASELSAKEKISFSEALIRVHQAKRNAS